MGGVRVQGSRERGFTLLEIVVVFSILALMAGSAAFVFLSPDPEKRIRKAHSGIEKLAFEARSMAKSYQVPFVLEFYEDEVRMAPLNFPGETSGEGVSEKENKGLKDLASMPWPRTHKIDGEYFVKFRGWGDKDFYRIERDKSVRWVHLPKGPCEPIAVELVAHDGSARMSRIFHPLTGRGEDYESTIYGD